MFIGEIPKSFFKENLLFTSTNNVQVVCQHFFAKTKTTYFNYIRRYKDGSKISLSNCSCWHKYFYENKLFENVLEIERQTIIEQPPIGAIKIVSWNNTPDAQEVQEQSVYFNIGNGISLAIVHGSYIEYCYFGTENKNIDVSNWYINNVSTLIEFIHYFKDKTANIIAEASLPKNRIDYCNNMKLLNEKKDLFISSQHDSDHVKPKRYFVDIGNKEIPITAREMDCIKYIFRGYPSSQVGRLLGISERTVEKHIENVKERLGCHSKSDLIDVLLESGLNSLIGNQK